MGPNGNMDRRRFLSSTAGLGLAGLAAAQTGHGQEPAKLAINGGEKAVTLSSKQPPRFGEPEKVQLDAMIQQDTLFYWKGPQTTAFTERFQQIGGHTHVMTCSSGTAALHIAVGAAGIGPGDEVITAPITDVGTIIGVIYQQGVPVFADLGAGTYNLDPAGVERRITPKTKAIIAVHLGGNPCDMDALRKIADAHGLILIEDCAQAWGAQYRGRPIGTVGDIACWSLQNSKHITCGDGGVVASNHESFGPKIQQYGDKGFNRISGVFESFSTNYRMSETQAAVAAGQLTRLEGIVAARARLGNLLTEKIAGAPGITPHEVHPEDRCVYWFYMLRVDSTKLKCSRDEFHKALSAEGVGCSPGYIPTTVHKSPVFQNHAFFNGPWPVKLAGLTDMDYTKQETPEAEAILKTSVRVVITESMPEEQILQTAEAIRKVAAYYSV
ncbi:MAG: DegT/DnrJ/EryC1/StrS family aminotransferase [Candidatus Hydrogenedentes bacterium]|nr:DegT/DnrJ/EryC1/StrS family aminotransferase [Candidatus Hydrogenedentota bacterium]